MTGPMGKCENCGKRDAQVWYAEDTLGLTHGMRAAYCPICVVEAQIEYAERAKARLPELKARRMRLLEAEKGEQA